MFRVITPTASMVFASVFISACSGDDGEWVNHAPTAYAGTDVTTHIGETVRLSGVSSADPDGDVLTFRWSLTTKPSASQAELSDPTSPRPRFTIDTAGRYEVELVVHDGALSSAADSLTVMTENSAPVAEVVSNRNVHPGEMVTLDGSRSSDADSDPLTYRWSITSQPSGSAASLSDETVVNPFFTTDLEGAYVIALLVNDGHVDSDPKSITIEAGNAAPTASAGADQQVAPGDAVQLDGTASADPEGDSITHRWSFASKPAASTAMLFDARAVNPTFTADVMGDYEVELIVNDGLLDSAPDTVRIRCGMNTAPVADAGADRSVQIGRAVTLDASGSSDADGDALTHVWRIAAKPPGSSAELSDSNAASPTLTPDVEGSYEVELVVSDGIQSSAPDAVVVAATSVPSRGSATQVAAGQFHTCVVFGRGRVRCWGIGHHGRLGYGNTDHIGDDETPASVGDVDVGGRVSSIAGGAEHTCAVLEAGTVRCWGRGSHGQLGYGNEDDIGDDETPASAGDVDVGGRVVQIAAGWRHTCALLDTGSVRCWGDASSGQLGYGNSRRIGDDETPASVGDANVGGRVASISAGAHHTCALLETGSVRCWGPSLGGQLGSGIEDSVTAAVAGDVPIGGTVTQIATAQEHTCAVLDAGNVRCWGRGDSGQLGYGNTDRIGDDEAPDTAGDVPIGGTATQIALGYFHTCAFLDSGNFRCWGIAASGQLGYGNTYIIGDDESPDTAGDVPIGGTATQLTAGIQHTCALLSTGVVRCWGDGGRAALGYGNVHVIGDDETPASVGDVPFE